MKPSSTTCGWQYKHRRVSTDEIVYHNFNELLEFVIGDVRDYHSVASVLSNADVVFNAAALKQVPTCEYFPFEAVQTNICGPENIVRAIRENHLPVDTVVGVSTDKAAKPVNVMGMTKAIQERVFITANLTCPKTRFICVRYGNVLGFARLGDSVVPRSNPQRRPGHDHHRRHDSFPASAWNRRSIRSLPPFAGPRRGETYIPRVPAARMIDLARALIGDRKIKIEVTGIRPGEKIDEILISEEERHRTVDRKKYYAIQPILPELRSADDTPADLTGEFSSATDVMSYEEMCAC